MGLASIALLLLLPATVAYINDNDLADAPDIICQQNSMKVLVNTASAFTGHIYVKGHLFDPNCHLDMSKGYQGFRNAVLTLPYRECDIPRSRAVEKGISGLQFTAVVVVQFHPTLLTEADKAFRLRCFYMEAEKSVTQAYEVSMLPTAGTVDRDRPMPNCAYTITQGPTGGPVRFAQIGDRVTHSWACTGHGDEQTEMGLLVHSCRAADAVGNAYQLLDERGCAIDAAALGNLRYDAGHLAASVDVATFRFATQMHVNFHCRLKLCLKLDGGCQGITPPRCPEPSSSIGATRLTPPPRDGAYRPSPSPEYRSGHSLDDAVPVPPLRELLPSDYGRRAVVPRRPSEPEPSPAAYEVTTSQPSNYVDDYDDGYEDTAFMPSQRPWKGKTQQPLPPPEEVNKVFPDRISLSQETLRRTERPGRQTGRERGRPEEEDLELERLNTPSDEYLNQLYEGSDSLGLVTTFRPFLARADSLFYDQPQRTHKRAGILRQAGPESMYSWEEKEGGGSWEAGVESEGLLVFGLDDPLPEEQKRVLNVMVETRRTNYPGSEDVAEASLYWWSSQELCLTRLGLIQALCAVGLTMFVTLVGVGWLQRRCLLARLEQSLLDKRLRVRHCSFQT